MATFLGGTYTEVSTVVTGGTVIIDGDDDLLTTANSAGEATTIVDVSVPQDFSFEFDFKPISLPPDLTALDTSRCYFAVYNQQDDTLGLIFSQSGLAWVSTLNGVTNVAPIPGSSSIVTEGEWYTVRAIVKGSTNLMYIYITLRDDIATTGHILRYTTSTVATVAPQADVIRIEGMGTAVDETQFKVETLRFSSKTDELIPNKPPVADPGEDADVLADNYAKLDGRGSYDPEGSAITYLWKMTRAPDGSQYTSSGVNGYTPSEVDPDSVTDTFKDDGGFDSLPLLQAGDLLVVDSIVSVIDASSFDASGDLVSTTTLTLTEATLTENQTSLPWKIYHQSAIGDNTAALTYAHTDVRGLYIFSLVVNDGSLDSLEAELLVQALDSNLKQATIPDLSYIWKVIGDEWDHVTDKSKIETIWEAFSLVAAGYLYWLWQVNACKSLETIPRKLARKWAALRTQISKVNWGDVTWSHIYPAMYGADITNGVDVNGKTLIITMDGTEYTITFSGPVPMSSTAILAEINTTLPVVLATLTSGKLTLQTDSYYKISSEGTANSALGFSTTSDTYSVLSGSSATPQGTEGPDNRIVDIADDIDLTEAGVNLRGYLFYANEKVHRIDHVISATSLALREPVTESGTYSWSILPMVRLENFDATELRINEYDKVKLSVTPDDGESNSVVSFVDSAGGMAEYVTVHPEAIVGTSGLIEVEEIKKAQYLPVYNETTSIPYLQQNIEGGTVLEENKDYSVEEYDNTMWVNFFTPSTDPPDVWWAEYILLSNDPTIEANFGYLVDFKAEDAQDLDYLSSVQALFYSYWKGPTVEAIKLGLQVIFGLPFAAKSGTILDINPLFSTTLGRILIQDDGDVGLVRAYYYDRDASIYTNPATGVAYEVGDTVAKFALLCTGIDVLDYIEDSDWFVEYIRQGSKFWEIQKYHKFFVGADVDIFGLNNILLAFTFLDRAKSSYDDYLASVYKNIIDEIDVNDQIGFAVTLNLYDNEKSTSGSPENGGVRMWDDYDGSGNIRHTYDGTDNWAYDTIYQQGNTTHGQEQGSFRDKSTARIMGGRLVTDEIVSLIDGETLVLEASDGADISSTLEIVGNFNMAADSYTQPLDFIKSGATRTASSKNGITFDTTTEWAGYSSIEVPYGASTYNYIKWSGLSVLGSEGSVALQVRRDEDTNWGTTDKIFFFAENSGSNNDKLVIRKTGANVEAQLWNSSGASITTLSVAHTFTLDTWYDLVFEYNTNSGGENRLYVDNELKANDFATGTRTTVPIIGLGADATYESGFSVDNLRTHNKPLRNYSDWIYAVADDGGAQTDESPEAKSVTADDMTLLPAVPQVSDAYYFGNDFEFSRIELNISTVATGAYTLAFEYWNGGWVALSGVTDGTGGFVNSGVNYITYTLPSDWATTSVNSVTAYWIRLRVTGLGTGQPLGQHSVIFPVKQEADITTETLFDPGETTITFDSPASQQEVLDQINSAIHRYDEAYADIDDFLTAAYYENSAGKYLLLNSWNRYIKVVSGTSLEHLGLTAGQESYRPSTPDPNLLALARFDGNKEKIIGFINSLGTQYNQHRQNQKNHKPYKSYHGTADTTNSFTETDLTTSSTESEISTYLNTLRTAYNAHDADSTSHTTGSQHQETGGASSADMMSIVSVANSLKAVYNSHLGDTSEHSLEDNDNLEVYDDLTWFAFDYVRDGGSFTTTMPLGAPTIESTGQKFGTGFLETSGGSVLQFEGNNVISNMGSSGSISFRWKPSYSGFPASNCYIMYLQDSSVSDNNQIHIAHYTSGNLNVFYNNDSGSFLAQTQVLAYGDFVAGTWYLLTIDFDFVHGYQAFRIEGVTKASGTATGDRGSGQQLMLLGDSYSASTGGGYDDFTFHSVVKYWEDFTPSVSPYRFDEEHHADVGPSIDSEAYLEHDYGSTTIPITYDSIFRFTEGPEFAYDDTTSGTESVTRDL
jgi:hypothetical protein